MGRGGARRGGARREGAEGGQRPERRSRLGDLSSRECFGPRRRLRGNFQTLAGEGGGREGKPAWHRRVIYIKQNLAVSKELLGRGWVKLQVPRCLSRHPAVAAGRAYPRGVRGGSLWPRQPGSACLAVPESDATLACNLVHWRPRGGHCPRGRRVCARWFSFPVLRLFEPKVGLLGKRFSSSYIFLNTRACFRGHRCHAA